MIETPTFQRLAAEFWSEEERLELVYVKAKFDNIPAAALAKLKEALDA